MKQKRLLRRTAKARKMDLNELAAKDNAKLLEYAGSFVVLSKPYAPYRLVSVKAFTRDISQHIDAQSGFSLGIRQISAVISFSSLDEVNFEYKTPSGEYTLTGDKIRISRQGELKEFEIIESRPDMQFGNFTVICDVCGQRQNQNDVNIGKNGKFGIVNNDIINEIRKKH